MRTLDGNCDGQLAGSVWGNVGNAGREGRAEGGLLDRVAAAPISWGICEVPGWGLQLPVDRVLAEMRELGLTETELGAIGWLPTAPDDLRRMLDTHGMRVVGAFVPLALHDPERRAQSLADAITMAELLEEIGAENFVTAAVSDPADWQRPDVTASGWQHLVGMLDEVESIAAAHGLQQVLHPHVDTLVETADEVERVLEASAVAFCLDTGHLTIGGVDPVQFAATSAGRIGLVHLKDVRTQVAARLNAGEVSLMAAVRAGLFAPLGDGDVAIAEVVTTLEGQGYSGRYVLEQDVALTADGAGAGPRGDVARSLEYLRSAAARRGATLRDGNAPR